MRISFGSMAFCKGIIFESSIISKVGYELEPSIRTARTKAILRDEIGSRTSEPAAEKDNP